MTRKKRKITFYYITTEEGENTKEVFNSVLTYIKNLESLKKRKNIVGNKFGFLYSIKSNENNDKHKLIFKSATNKYRPPLLNKETVIERESPKTIDEGETYKTHIVTKIINGDFILISEKYRDGLTIKQIIKYLNYFALNLELPLFNFEIIAKDDFLEELDNLERVISAEVFVDKQLLGSDALNYSERTNSVKHDVVINVKAKNRESIRDFARDTFAKLNGAEQVINRIRITGKNYDNNIVMLNTNIIERQEWVNPEYNDVTGEIITSEIIRDMENVINNFN
ncbi:hypothetical protein G1K66_12410 [Tenacibaculum finnmarkense]|uniref:hypothetical protein n=1 Tax=Tenacibaculum finnmarkense TaxID=2781243 RepID=UPI001E2FF3F9|nr:hypothetical protein [Tenacibaculum finnmarkense]MCD8401399.1 hypothetical protein [Tenacibaculum finnmarkense genomovar ulcerans]MCG8814059.1 hypothetical protein [Tenacibaculum finnmarkense]